jgi:hypothetical protein
MFKYLSLVVFFFTSSILFAQTLVEKRKSFINSNLFDDNADCYSYYSIQEEGLNRSKAYDKIDYKDLKITFTKRAFNLGREIGMKDEAMFSKIKISFDKQSKEIKSDFKNFSILAVKYGEFCNELFEKPDKRLSYWKDRASKEIR